MIKYKSAEEIELIRDSCLLVSKTLSEITSILKAGISTIEINNSIEKFILDNDAIPAFKGYNDFPFASCISVNDTVVHGFPNKELLKNGDLVSIDIGILKNKYYGDSAYTFIIGDTTKEHKLLLQRTKASLYKGIEYAKVGNRIGDIGYAIQNATETQHNYGVVRDLVGHGIGKKLHEDPQVPNYGKKGNGIKIQTGLVIAIEPMITLGTKDIYMLSDQWTIKTKDHKMAAHYEHTVAVLKNTTQILSSFVDIEKAIKKNINLWNEEL